MNDAVALIERGRRFARLVLEEYGREKEFEINLSMPYAPQVILALEESGCIVEKDPLRRDRYTIVCTTP